MNDCYILRFFDTSKGEVVLIDFPPDKIPLLGMKLLGKKSGLQWEITGLGLPVVLELLPEKIEPHYNSTRIWDCLLKPINHSMSLKDENILEIGIQQTIRETK